MDAAQAMAEQMLQAPPESLVRYKQLLDDAAAVPFSEALPLERLRSLQTNVSVTAQDVRRRLAALLGKKANAL